MEDDYLIKDVRDENDLRKITFSGYKPSDVKKELFNSLKKNNIEISCYWTAEMVVSGLYIELWDIILLFLGKSIHTSNPFLATYINIKFKEFKKLAEISFSKDAINMRNSDKIRKIFSEISIILSLSKKGHEISFIKIEEYEYNILEFRNKLTADKNTYSENLILVDDPQEISIPLNELIYNINNNDLQKACYWAQWIIMYPVICKKKGLACLGHKRFQHIIEEKYNKELVWLVWDTLIKLSEKKSKLENNIILNLFDLFKIRYRPTQNKKRIYLIYLSIEIMGLNLKSFTPIVFDKNKVLEINKQYNIVYKQIIKNNLNSLDNSLFLNSKNNKKIKINEKLKAWNNLDNKIMTGDNN
jgi:hypothetical protein